MPDPVTWSYGVTSVRSRLNSHLPATLKSLSAAGFPSPRLFVDDCFESQLPDWVDPKTEVTCRHPRVRVAANWMLSMMELYLRSPRADRYCIFQDDIQLVRNLRQYLDECPFPERGYWNPYQAHVRNRILAASADRDGWFRSDQLGKGAAMLVFDNAGVRDLLASPLLVGRAYDCPEKGWRGVDGGISEALCRRGPLHSPHECNLSPTGHTEHCKRGWYTEWCHRPSLVQHVGTESEVDRRKGVTEHEEGHPKFLWDGTDVAEDFPGEDWDAYANLTQKPAEAPSIASGGRSGEGVGITPWEPEAWRSELQALVNAIEGDERRLREQPGRRGHFERLLADYRRRLAEHERVRPEGV